MPTSNPALSVDTFRRESDSAPAATTMTVAGAAAKSAFLVTATVVAAAFSWGLIFPDGLGSQPNGQYVTLFGMVAPLAGFVVALVTIFVPKASPFTAPVYAVLEGLFLGAISAFMNSKYQGIVAEAGLLTGGVLAVMATMYATRMIVPSDKLRAGIVAATGAICLAYLASFVLRLCGVPFPYIHDSGPISIAFSVVVVLVAAFNLVLDFETIEVGARVGAPKYMEWYAAFGLLVTLVWLYLEILRLLAKLRNAND